MVERFSQIIVGGGIIGCSIAYQLALRGHRVALIEQGTIGNKASNKAAGMLGAQAEIDEEGPLLELALQSRALVPKLVMQLKTLTNVDIGFVHKGMLKVALSDEEVPYIQEKTAFHKRWDEEVEYMTQADLRRLEPNLSDSVKAGMWIPRDGQVMPDHLTTAFAQGAAALGTTIYEHTALLRLIVENGEVVGVETTRGKLLAEHVIVATGAWTSQVAAQVGLDLTVYPIKGEALVVKPAKPILTRTLFSEQGIYLVPKADGRMYIGATSTPHSFSETVSNGGVFTLLKKAIDVLPALQEAEFIDCWAGSRPQTVDGLPYMGSHPTVNGLHIAAGHYRNGILLAPITGVWMADLIEGRGQVPFATQLSVTRGMLHEAHH